MKEAEERRGIKLGKTPESEKQIVKSKAVEGIEEEKEDFCLPTSPKCRCHRFEMRKLILLSVLLSASASASASAQQHPVGSALDATPEEVRAEEFVARAEEQLLANTQKATLVEWDYYTNITDHNEKARLEYQVCSLLLLLLFFFAAAVDAAGRTSLQKSA